MRWTAIWIGAALAVAAGGGAQAASRTFDLFNQICLQNAADPVAAEAKARALGFVDSGRPTSADPAKGVTSADLVMPVDGITLVMGIDDKPADMPGVREFECGVVMPRPNPEAAAAVRAWAALKPTTSPDGGEIWAWDGGAATWTPIDLNAPSLFEDAAAAGNLRIVTQSDSDKGTLILLISFRKPTP